MGKFKNLFVILFGIIFLAIGIFMFMGEQKKASECTEQTVAMVVDIVEEEDYDEENGYSYSYFPVLEYQVGDEVITKKHNVGSSPAKYDVNDEVVILYNPEKTDEFIIKGEKTSYILVGAFAVMGAVIAICGVVAQIKSSKVEE